MYMYMYMYEYLRWGRTYRYGIQQYYTLGHRSIAPSLQGPKTKLIIQRRNGDKRAITSTDPQIPK